MKSTRRSFAKTAIIASSSLLPVSLLPFSSKGATLEPIYSGFPQVNPKQVREVVSAAHARLDHVKELVGKQPELARAVWDWGFGDFESALGAAAHMGRRDIAEYLIEHGARPDIYTYTMLGCLPAVKSMVEAIPGIQKTFGPHGITLLQHAKNRLRHQNLEPKDQASVEEVLQYLESLGDADPKEFSIEISDQEKADLEGEYRSGTTILQVSINRQGYPSIALKGEFGRAMRKIGSGEFGIFGSPGIRIMVVGTGNNIESLVISGLGESVQVLKI